MADHPKYPSKLGARIRWCRQFRKLTQQKLARLANIKGSTISDLENGRSAKSLNLAAIARALDANIDYLETGKGEPFDANSVAEPAATYSVSTLINTAHARLQDWDLNDLELLERKVQDAVASIESNKLLGPLKRVRRKTI